MKNTMHFDALQALTRRPAPFSVSTVKELWTKPYLAEQMLLHHLSQDSPHSSRLIPDIDRIVSWIDAQLDLDGKRVVDLGCGPGLYVRRMAQKGAYVTGVDFSANSLEYARSRDMERIEYLQADYLQDDLPGGFDIAVLIYYDYCAMGPENRALLLGKIHHMLKPGGHLVIDLAGPGAFDAIADDMQIEERMMGGFFAPGDYVGIHKTDVYEEDGVSLDRFLVLEPDDSWQIYNWVKYYTPESAAAELGEAGFMVNILTGGLDGETLSKNSQTIGVVAEKAVKINPA